MMTFFLPKLIQVAALSAAAVIFSNASADEIWIVTQPNTTLKDFSAKKLENIFLRKTLLNDAGIRWVRPQLGHRTSAAPGIFTQSIQKRPEALESYWNEQYFQGIVPPHVVVSEEAMLRFVTSTAGAIGYILPCHLDERVQVIYKLPTAEPVDQYCKDHAP